MLLAEGSEVGNKELREYNEVKVYADAADGVYRQATAPAVCADGVLTRHHARGRAVSVNMRSIRSRAASLR
jgi:hypothetical protein